MHTSLFSVLIEKCEDFYISIMNFKFSRREIMFKLINFNSIFIQIITYFEPGESKVPSRGDLQVSTKKYQSHYNFSEKWNWGDIFSDIEI